ncbi:MAG: class I SAM-dependent methyltransferase [Pseudomonadota bacterium]
MTASATSNPFLEMFENPEHARNYSEGPLKFTPGFADVHKMTSILIGERVTQDAQILVHGAGGGLELEALALTNPFWRFVGVDPAKAMLDEAQARLESVMDRVTLHHGFIDTAPVGPFDGATSLLTLHFLEASERLETIRKIVARLRTGAPFVAVHSSFAQNEPDRNLWLSRYERFAVASGVDPNRAKQAREAVGSMSTTFEPEADMQLLKDAGLTDVATFYSAFTWRGWVGYAP